MGDFIQNSAVKTATRTLATPIPDIETFNSIVASVIASNPFGCISYISAGVTHAPVEKTKETYTVRIIYQDNEAKVVGNNRDQFSTVAGFTSGAAALLADTALSAAHGGVPARDFENETFATTLRCHDPSGEIYSLSLSRTRLSLTSFEDDAIQSKVETWADTVPELA